MDCLKNIIGVTKTEDPCFSSSFTSAATTSESGKYMDQLEEFPSLDVFKAVAAGERTSLENHLLQARENGIQNLQEDLFKALGNRYAAFSRAYLGSVGQSSYVGTLSPGFTFAGVVYEMKQYRGASVKIKGVLASFSGGTGTLNVSVYRGYNNGVTYMNVTKVGDFDINLSNNSTAQAITPIILPTTDELGKAYSYMFLYSSSGLTPRDNGTSCGCGGKETVLNQYLVPYGISGAAVENMLTSNRTSYVNGLILDIEARCTGGDFLCDNFYSNPLIAEAVTWAVLRKSVSNAIVSILASDMINRYTMTKREQMSISVKILNSKYKTSVEWIAENLDLSGNDCLICNPTGNGGTFSTTTGGIHM